MKVKVEVEVKKTRNKREEDTNCRQRVYAGRSVMGCVSEKERKGKNRKCVMAR
jgi:hypothetical protein